MNSADMQDLVSRHLRAKEAGGVDAAIAVYTDDVEHDVVGYPGSPHLGKDEALKF